LDAYKVMVLTGERALLLALSFDVSPSQQHSALVTALAEVGWAAEGEGADGRILTQAAFNFLNDRRAASEWCC